MRPLFTQERVAASAGLFLDGLLGEERRKTGWMRVEAAGDPGPWRQQAILGRGRWDADGLRDIVREYVVETLAAADAVLVLDETGFLKQGKASCGVARQYTGSPSRGRYDRSPSSSRALRSPSAQPGIPGYPQVSASRSSRTRGIAARVAASPGRSFGYDGRDCTAAWEPSCTRGRRMPRIHILGASGSGTTTLGAAV